MQRHRRPVVLSYALSGLVHVGLVVGLLLLSVPAAWPDRVSAVDTVLSPSSAPDASHPSRDTDVHALMEARQEPPVVSGDDVLAEAVPDDRLAEFTRQQLRRAREQSTERTAAEQSEELETLARRLSRLSSEESISQLTDAISPWIGSGKPRATRPRDHEVDEPFDASTAQVSDVLKQQTDETVQYVAVMVDAAGRTVQTPLAEEDGKTLYDVFRLMKQFPLLETVYRQTVMGLLDRLIEEEQAAASENLSESQQPGEQQDEHQQ